MNKELEQAVQIIDNVVSRVQGTRADHDAILKALQLIVQELNKEPVVETKDDDA